MSTPLVSIIIPTYNRAHLIGETLDSILAQSYTNWECIVVDDGSSDNTDIVLGQYMERDSRIRYVHRSNGHLPGGNGARNYGLELASGQYIQWFDSDDWMYPGNLQIRILMAHQHRADVIVAAHGNTPYLEKEVPRDVQTFSSDSFHMDYLLGKKPMITNDLMVRRESVGELRFDEHLFKAQEFEFFSRLFNQHLVYAFTEAHLTHYRDAEDSISPKISSNGLRQHDSLIYLSKLMMERHKEYPEIVGRFERQGRKTYKFLVGNGYISTVLKHFIFFQKCYNRSFVSFSFYLMYNFITKRGFDKIKSKIQ